MHNNTMLLQSVREKHVESPTGVSIHLFNI